VPSACTSATPIGSPVVALYAVNRVADCAVPLRVMPVASAGLYVTVPPAGTVTAVAAVLTGTPPDHCCGRFGPEKNSGQAYGPRPVSV
jgi:hypothetical protein